MEDLLDPGSLGEKVAALVEWKNLTVEKGYGHAPVSAQETLSWLETYALPLREYVCDAGAYLDGRRRRKNPFSSRPSWAPCGILTLVSTPTPPLPARSRPTPPSARAFPPGGWTG